MSWFGGRYSNGMFYGTLSASISSCSIAASLRRMPGPNCSHVSIMSLWCGRSVIVVSWWRHHHNMTAPLQTLWSVFLRGGMQWTFHQQFWLTHKDKGLGHLSESKPGIAFNIFPVNKFQFFRSFPYFQRWLEQLISWLSPYWLRLLRSCFSLRWSKQLSGYVCLYLV